MKRTLLQFQHLFSGQPNGLPLLTPVASALNVYSLARWPMFLTLALYLLFAHGCHRNDDADLLRRLPGLVARAAR